MGIILRPRPGQASITAEGFVTRLRDNGFDVKIKQSAAGPVITINHDDLGDEPLGLVYSTGDRLWFGVCFPTEKDPQSRTLMRIASLIGYDAEGE